MHAPAETESPALEAAAPNGETSQPVRRSARRRLVQSKLFPHRSPEIESNGGLRGNEEGNGDGEDAQDEQEDCGSQGRKRKTRKGKTTTPQNKTPKKSKEKSPRESTPRKGRASNREGSSPPSAEKQEVSPAIPNLRLEEKLKKEKFSWAFSEKEVHPFFSSWKENKRASHEAAQVDTAGSLVQMKNKNITVAPIHVFDRDQDDAVSLDWRNFEFSGDPFNNGTMYAEPSSSSVMGSTVSPSVQEFPGVSNFSSTSLLQDGVSLDHWFPKPEPKHEASTSVSTMPSDAQAECCPLERVAQPGGETDEVGLAFGRNSGAEQLTGLVPERLLSLHPGCTNQLEDRLWIDKYQPRNAMEVCGNSEAVKFLNEWLRTWYQGAHQTDRDSFAGIESDMQDTDYKCSLSECDSEDIDEGDTLKNVLLITGPVGSGKSAAIYACAKGQGFKVLEINASDCRNGALVKQRYGEALNSHSLEWSRENCTESQSKSMTEIFSAFPIGKMVKEADNEVVEVIPISNEDSFQGAGGIFEKVAYKESSVSCGKGQLKHLILFEDVDVAFAEDRGFVAAVQQIAENAKGPLILTSNCENPDLPSNLDRLEVCFMMPKTEELLQHVQMVCFAEKANIQPHLIEQVIKSCQGDIRKTIMHLQFWSLGENHREGREVEGLTEQLLSDPEFMHHLLPKLIPWDFPSLLSELVEKEISMSLSMEENSISVEVIEDKCDDKEMQKTFDLHHLETASMKAKKEEMLSRNFSDEDFQDYKTPLDAPCDFNSSGTPVSFSRRNRRRNFDVVLSSDSDDEFPNKKFHFSPDKDAKNEETYIDSGLPSHCASVQNCLSLLTDLQPGFQAEKPAEKHYSCSDTVRDLQIAGTCESIDVSCVPESSFVPETIIDIGTEVSLDGISSGHVASPLCEVSVSNEIKQNELPAEANNGCKSTLVNPKDVVLSGSICEEIAVSSQEFNDSQPECVEAMTRECQIMDECSRMDFKQNFRPVENHGSSVGGNLASNPWRKLHDGRTDLKFLVTSENKNVTAILKLACGMSNLISDAELLYSRCQMLSSLESTELCEVYSFGCYSEQLKLTSNIAQYGFFSYSKDIDAVGSNLGSDYRVNLTKEMLSLSSMMKASLLPGRNIGTCETSLARPIMETSRPDCETLFDSDMKSNLVDVTQSIVPSKTYMAMKGDAFHEYVSFLRCISRSETARLSNDIGKTKRRRRARHYLSTGSLMLSLNQISLLEQSNIYNKIPSR